MKIKYPVNSLFLVCFILSSIYSCKKEAIKTTPTITISTVSNISTTSAASGGVVTSDGGAALQLSSVAEPLMEQVRAVLLVKLPV